MKILAIILLFFGTGYLKGYQKFESAWEIYRQPNGVTFEAKYSGGPYLFHFENRDGYRFVGNWGSWWYYAKLDKQGDYEASSFRVGIDNPPAYSYQLERTQEKIQELQELTDELDTPTPESLQRYDQIVALADPDVINIGLVLVKFPDVAVTTTQDFPDGFPATAYADMVFSQDHYYDSVNNYGTNPTGELVFGSLQDYFWEQSYHHVSIEGNLINNIHAGRPVWIELPHDFEYYNNISNTLPGTRQAIINDLNLNQLLWPNGPHHYLAIIYGGRNQYGTHVAPNGNGNSIIFGETDGRDFQGMGLYAHELGHCFGWSHVPQNNLWYLMGVGNLAGPDHNGTCPTPMRMAYKVNKNWVTPIEIYETHLGFEIGYNYSNPTVYVLRNVPDPELEHYLFIQGRDGFEKWTPIVEDISQYFDDPLDPNANWGGLMLSNYFGTYTRAHPIVDHSTIDNPNYEALSGLPFPYRQGQDIHDGTVPQISGNAFTSYLALRSIVWDNQNKTATMDIYVGNWGGPPETPANFTLTPGPDNHPLLAWSPNTEPDIQSYIVKKTYINIGGRTSYEIDVGISTTYIDSSFTIQQGGFTEAIYTVKALDTGSLISPVANALSTEGIGALMKPSLLEASSWYPLQMNNRWQYRVFQRFADSTSVWYYSTEVIGDSTLDNQLSYRVLRSQKLTGEFLEDTYLRCDTILRKVFKYKDSLSCSDSEIVIADFSSDPDDGFWQDCIGNDWVSSYYYNEIDTPVVIMGVINDLFGRNYTYQKELGLQLYQEIEHGINYEERLVAAEIGGFQWGEFYTGIDEIQQLPNAFGLTTIYPNPSNAAVTIRYQIPSDRTEVKILVYNLSGSLVYTSSIISNSRNNVGIFTWDVRDTAGKLLPSGIYVSTLNNANSKVILGNPIKFTIVK